MLEIHLKIYGGVPTSRCGRRDGQAARRVTFTHGEWSGRLGSGRGIRGCNLRARKATKSDSASTGDRPRLPVFGVVIRPRLRGEQNEGQMHTPAAVCGFSEPVRAGLGRVISDARLRAFRRVSDTLSDRLWSVRIQSDIRSASKYFEPPPEAPSRSKRASAPPDRHLVRGCWSAALHLICTGIRHFDRTLCGVAYSGLPHHRRRPPTVLSFSRDSVDRLCDPISGTAGPAR